MAEHSGMSPFLVHLDGPGKPPTAMMLPVRLKPLRKRLWAALCFAWSLWIPPWDRVDHGSHSSLRSPLVAWRVAWGIHHDDMEALR